MKMPSSKNNKSSHSKPFGNTIRGLLALLAGLTLAACDSVPNEANPSGGGGGAVPAYTGDACGVGLDPSLVSDACNFKVEFWDNMRTYVCKNCHDTQTGGTDSPFFVENSNVNTAYNYAQTVINRNDVASSRIVTKIAGGHNCGDNASCANLANVIQGYINNWINGGAPTGGGSQPNEIEYVAPNIRSVGSSRSFPPAPGNFSTTVWPLLTANCSGCHKESSNNPQAPFFAEDDVNAAYDAVVTSKKMNLDNPAISRLVVRLRQEFHNCWDPNGTGTDCAASADLMENAITSFASSITPTTVDSNWVVSKAMHLGDGIIASGGTRDDSSTIALYEFKSGEGSDTVLDSSGVPPALNLSLSGTEGVDYKWVGGWGVEFLGGKAQGTFSNTEPNKLRDRIVATGEYSIEAWVVPGNVSQGTAGDPARIISFSAGTQERNFTLGQAEYRYEFMNRSSNSNNNGEISFITDDMDEDLQATQQHVVATFDPQNGRKIYVNGVDVSTTGNADIDPVNPGSLVEWDDSFAFVLGNETSNNKMWAGKLRLVAIHNRALTAAQVQQNFDAGVGEKFHVLFSVSELMNEPACFLPDPDPAKPDIHQCYILFEVSQFDSYSYLFNKPTFISLNPAFTPSGQVIKAMRLGLNGQEPGAGQAYVNLGVTNSVTLNSTDYDAATGKQVLANLGTIIAQEKGPADDEFFLTFEVFDSNTDNSRVAEVCGVNKVCTTTPPADTTAPAEGLRTFEEILAAMAEMTGVDPYQPQFVAVKNTYYDKANQTGIKQQMPSVEDVNGFLPAHQMAVSQLAIQFCDALVEDGTLRSNFFGSFGFDQPVDTAFGSGDSAQKNQIVNALFDKMVGLPDLASTSLADMPSRADLKAELIGNPDPAITGHPGNLYDRLYATCTADPTCTNDAVRTRAVVKAMCTVTLGSAAMLIQ